MFDINSEQFLGYVVGTVVDRERERLLGLVTRTRFARPKMAVPVSSVHLFHEEGIMIERSGFRWLPLQTDMWLTARSNKKAGPAEAVLGGETVGTVVDYTVNDDGRVTHVIIQRGLVGKLLKVRRDKVIEIEENVMTLAHDALAQPKPKARTGGGFVDQAAAIFGRTLAKASHRVRTGARSGLLGKPAPWTIKDGEGHILVKEGMPLTPEALAAEGSRGRTGALTGAVAGGALGRSLAKRRKKSGK